MKEFQLSGIELERRITIFPFSRLMDSPVLWSIPACSRIFFLIIIPLELPILIKRIIFSLADTRVKYSTRLCKCYNIYKFIGNYFRKQLGRKVFP